MVTEHSGRSFSDDPVHVDSLSGTAGPDTSYGVEITVRFAGVPKKRVEVGEAFGQNDGEVAVAAIDETMVVGGQWFKFYLEHFLLTFSKKCVTHQDQAPGACLVKGVTQKCITLTDSTNIVAGAETTMQHIIRRTETVSAVRPVSKHITERSRSTLRQKRVDGRTYASRLKRSNAKFCYCR